jgi:hypothetical protein
MYSTESEPDQAATVSFGGTAARDFCSGLMSMSWLIDCVCCYQYAHVLQIVNVSSSSTAPAASSSLVHFHFFSNNFFGKKKQSSRYKIFSRHLLPGKKHDIVFFYFNTS